jgi:hypothetical protein
MHRIWELIAEIINIYPADRFFENFDQITNSSPNFLCVQYRAYECAFGFVDSNSWIELRAEARVHFTDHRNG